MTEPTAPAPPLTAIQAVAAVMRDIGAVGKDRFNQGQKFNFRGIDDLMNAVAQPLRDHGVVVVPTVTERVSEVRGKLTAVWLTVTFRFYGPAGDYIEAVTVGEAADSFDKATNKAMSAALKYALLDVFMIPVDGSFIEDGDRHSPEGVRDPDPAPGRETGLFNAIRQAWNDPVTLKRIQQQATEAKALNLTTPGPDGQPVTVDQLLQRRLRELATPPDRGGNPSGNDHEAALAALHEAAARKNVTVDDLNQFAGDHHGRAVAELTTAEIRDMTQRLDSAP